MPQRRLFRDVALPWTVFAAVTLALYEMWPLFFMAFVLGSLVGKAADRLAARGAASRRQALALVYALLVLFFVVVVWVVVPRAYGQARDFLRKLPVLVQDTYDHIQTSAQDSMGDLLPRDILSSLREDSLSFVKRHLDDESIARTVHLFTTAGRLVLFAFLAVILSLLVQWDGQALARSVGRLADGPAGAWYRLIVPSVVEFFTVIAEVFDAQVVIALINTSLTCAGMLLLGIRYAAFLSMLVFVCGLIPVLGVFISSVPILLLSIQGGGFALAIKALVMILFVHAMETYVLNPRIMGEHLRVHPVTVLLTLLIGEHYFGVWGVLLGLPAVTFAARKLLPPAAPGASPPAAPRGAPPASPPPAPPVAPGPAPSAA